MPGGNRLSPRRLENGVKRRKRQTVRMRRTRPPIVDSSNLAASLSPDSIVRRTDWRSRGASPSGTTPCGTWPARKSAVISVGSAVGRTISFCGISKRDCLKKGAGFVQARTATRLKRRIASPNTSCSPSPRPVLTIIGNDPPIAFGRWFRELQMDYEGIEMPRLLAGLSFGASWTAADQRTNGEGLAKSGRSGAGSSRRGPTCRPTN